MKSSMNQLTYESIQIKSQCLILYKYKKKLYFFILDQIKRL